MQHKKQSATMSWWYIFQQTKRAGFCKSDLPGFNTEMHFVWW